MMTQPSNDISGWGRLHAVSKGRKVWTCAQCGTDIAPGTPHFRRNHYMDASDRFSGEEYRFCHQCGPQHDTRHPVSTTFPVKADPPSAPDPTPERETHQTSSAASDPLDRLRDPFPDAALTWKIQTCGENDRGVWALVVPYLKTDAIRDRLDTVIGPANWKTEQFIPGPAGGLQCGLSIRVDGEWLTKWDGADNTEIESIKGGMSDAFKRAARCWGIGRYLTSLDAQFATISDRGTFRGKTKSGTTFRWDPPGVPSVPTPPRQAAVPSPGAAAPTSDLAEQKQILRLKIGRLRGQKLDNGNSAFAYFMHKLGGINGSLEDVTRLESEIYQFQTAH